MRVTSTPTHKVCTACRINKPIGEFYLRRDRPTLRPISKCKLCSTKLARRWNVENRRHIRERNRSRHVAALGQPDRCEICGVALDGFHHRGPVYDHNHDTGASRGWLCNKCNAGIGMLGDNPRLIKRAIQYLLERGYAPTRPVFR